MVTAVLLDTHIFIWLLYSPDKIHKTTLEAIKAAPIIYVSVVSLFELAAKKRAGKLVYDLQEIADNLAPLGCELLPLKIEHTLAMPAIVLPQKDPFDAQLVAQAQVEQLLFVTADSDIQRSA